VRAVLVVVEQESAKLAFVPDEGAVEQFVTQRAHPSFGERVRLGCSRAL